MKSKTKKIPADDGFNPELVLGARFRRNIKVSMHRSASRYYRARLPHTLF